MKAIVNMKNIIALWLMLLLSMLITACGEKESDSSITEATSINSITEISTTIASTQNLSELQVIEEILMLYEPYYYTEENVEEDAELMMDNAEMFSNLELGSIKSEEEAKEKGRTVLIKLKGKEYIDEIESNFVTIDEQNIEYERNKPQYSVSFYEEYDAWIVRPNLPSGTAGNNMRIATPGTTPYVIIRGSDGKVLAIFC